MPLVNIDGSPSAGPDSPSLKAVIAAAAPWLFAAVVALLALL